MTHQQEIILVLLVLAGAVAYAAWRIYKTVKEDDPCKTCELKKNCKKFGQSKEK